MVFFYSTFTYSHTDLSDLGLQKENVTVFKEINDILHLVHILTEHCKPSLRLQKSHFSVFFMRNSLSNHLGS